MLLMVPTKVKVGTKTSSPFLTPAILRATCSAAVPVLHAITYLAFVKFEIFCSKFFTNFPLVEIQLLLRHSLTNFEAFLIFILGG